MNKAFFYGNIPLLVVKCRCGMERVLFNLFYKKCYLCHKKVSKKKLRKYLDDKNKDIHICERCVEYAERRAFRKAQ